MRWILALALVLAGPVGAQDSATQDPELGVIQPAEDVELSALLWAKRPIIVFADSEADPRFVQQMQFIERELEALSERDVVVITDTDPSTLSPLREKLRPRGFMMVLIGKDGGVKLRKPLPWSVREISRTIDKMPMRQQEIRDRRAAREDS
ncbi:DUF4174 domain-containing protein [Roseobacteraceae bacterium S113]